MLDARTKGPRNEMGSDPRFGSGRLCQTIRPLFCWGSRQSEPQVREPKRNGCFQGCHWENLGPRPPEYGYKQEGPVQFQWVAIHDVYGGDGFLGKQVTTYTVRQPLEPAPFAQPHVDQLIFLLASRSLSVTAYSVSPKSVARG